MHTHEACFRWGRDKHVCVSPMSPFPRLPEMKEPSLETWATSITVAGCINRRSTDSKVVMLWRVVHGPWPLCEFYDNFSLTRRDSRCSSNFKGTCNLWKFENHCWRWSLQSLPKAGHRCPSRPQVHRCQEVPTELKSSSALCLIFTWVWGEGEGLLLVFHLCTGASFYNSHKSAVWAIRDLWPISLPVSSSPQG